MVEQVSGPLVGEQPGVLKRMATMSLAKVVSVQNLITQLARRFRGHPRPAGQRDRLLVPSAERHEMGTRSRSRSPKADGVRGISYNQLVQLLDRKKEVLIAFYDSEEVSFTPRRMG
jgi:hypothetical protein